MITHTLAFLVDGGRVLLGRHQRGVGVGKWNGFGGKVEAGEVVELAMVREVMEESGLTPTSSAEAAELHFSIPFEGKRQEWACRVYVVTAWEGSLRASEEMIPQWFEQSDLPFEQMWEDDPLWLPRVLAGERIMGEFVFDSEGKVLNFKLNK